MSNYPRKIIGVDFDDVLSDFNDAIVVFYNTKYGTSYTRDHITTYALEDTWGCTQEEAHKRIADFYHTEEHQKTLPVHGAVEGVTALSTHNTLYVVTARPHGFRERTLLWLEKHFPNIFKGVHFTQAYLGDKNARNKAEICKELGIELFVEDSLKNARRIAEVGIPVFLIDTPWNQGEPHPLVTRVQSWEEIVKTIT